MAALVFSCCIQALCGKFKGVVESGAGIAHDGFCL
jgi:hypothetical protein